MSATPYTYRVVRYVHDPAAGEMLNVGVVLYAPSVPFVGACFEHRYGRLSRAFAGFDGESYRTAVRRFEASIQRVQEGWRDSLPGFREVPAHLEALVTQIWPDAGLSLRLGPVLAGVGEDPARALASLFERLVASRQPHGPEERRTDKDVWTVYQQPLAQEAVSTVLQAKTFDTEAYQLEFEHAFKNDQWHILQPVSLDYVRPDKLQDKAIRLLGQASALKGNQEVGRLYLLLGAPRQPSHKKAYDKAKLLLRGVPVEHEIVEEDQAEEFAGRLAEYIREHNVAGADHTE